jgi:hypothetical protein
MVKIILLSFVCLIGLTLSAAAQSLDELEKRYENLRSVVEKDNLILDSLKNILENRAKQIENEKQKQNPDNDKIIKLMSGSVSLSNLIEDYQEKLDANSKNLKQLSKMLEARYSAKINSLQLLKKSGKENSEKLDGEILLYTEKRLIILPQVDLLSFNPKKILEIDLNKANGNDEKASLKEYLSSALAEVNSVLSEVIKQAKETDDALTLQKKTSKFLAETEFDRDFRTGKSSGSTNARTYETTILEPQDKLTLADQINFYALLLDQLNIFDKSENINLQKLNFKPGKANLSLKDYSSLLKELKQRLSDYKLILTNKIEQSK